MTARAHEPLLYPPVATPEEEPAIARVTLLAAMRRLQVEGASADFSANAVANSVCRGMVGAAIWKDIERAHRLSIESQLIFMHPKRTAVHGPRDAGVSGENLWLQEPGEYYWLEEVIYIVENRSVVTTIHLNESQMDSVERIEAAHSKIVHTARYEPVLEKVEQYLASKSNVPDLTRNVHPLRPVRSHSSRVTPHLPRRLTTPGSGSRLLLITVGEGDRQHDDACHACVRIAYRHDPLEPKNIFIDSAVLPNVDLSDPHRSPTIFEELLETCTLHRMPAPPVIDWEKERTAQKLPASVAKWWEAFYFLLSSKDERIFTCVVVTETARLLLEILQPSGMWRNAERQSQYLRPGVEHLLQWANPAEDQLRSFGFMDK